MKQASPCFASLFSLALLFSLGERGVRWQPGPLEAPRLFTHLYDIGLTNASFWWPC